MGYILDLLGLSRVLINEFDIKYSFQYDEMFLMEAKMFIEERYACEIDTISYESLMDRGYKSIKFRDRNKCMLFLVKYSEFIKNET